MSTQGRRHLYEFGPFRLDPEEGQLLRDGESIPLTHKAFEMLRLLVENNGHVVAKDDFLKEIWPETFIEEGVLTVNIANLRKALGEDRSSPRYIETVPRRGYRFIASVKEVSNEVGVKEPSSVEVRSYEEETNRTSLQELTDQKSIEPIRWKRSTTWAGSLMMLAAVVALSYVWVRSKPNPSSAPAVKTIAVLPFKPLVAEKRDEALEVGMAETVITKLSGIRQITLRPLSSVHKYARIDQDPVAAGRELHVDAVLDASLQWDGDKNIRVTARLWRVSDGSVMWTDKFDEQFSTIFLAQDRIAERVAGALTPRLSGEEKKQLTKHYTDSPEAYELYCQGRFFSRRASAEGWKKGFSFFEQAIEKDPKFALAHASLALAFLNLGERGLLPPETNWLQKGEAEARGAVEIDNTLVEAHLALGFALMHDWHFTAAESEYKLALQLDPDSDATCDRYSHFLWNVGRFDDAITYAKRAREINPVSVVANSGLARAYFEAGHYDQAIEQYKRALEIDPGFVPAIASLAGAYANEGMYDEAIIECKRAIAIDNSPQRRGQLTQLGLLYARSGNKEEARKELDELKEHARKQYMPPYNFALLYEALGEKDLALDWLEKAYLARQIEVTALNRGGFTTLRSDQRFIDLLRRIDAAID